MIAEDESIHTATAEQWKEKGNILFKSSSFRDAAELYTKAIEVSPEVPTYWSNRAAAYLNDSQFKLSLNDSLQALKLDPLLVKAFFRAAKAQVHLGNLEDAAAQLSNLKEALSKSGMSPKTIQSHLATSSKDMAEVTLLQSKVSRSSLIIYLIWLDRSI